MATDYLAQCPDCGRLFKNSKEHVCPPTIKTDGGDKRERMARVGCEDFLPLTVFAQDGDILAFKYDNGGYGWAHRTSFVPIEEAQRAVAERAEQRKRAVVDENLRARLRIGREIARVEKELQRLNDILALYPEPVPE